MPNRLAGEKSPYLLQHAANPVDWYPWGPEAFARAQVEDKPIFLSVGYSTCHWCHVMEHESFEHPDIAAALNRDFVAIKVDREERPDVDRVYMTFVQATTGSGGWPMSVWLTPDLKPFYGGTYFPPDARWNRPGFGDVLREVARTWRERRAEVLHSADHLTAQLQGLAHRDARAQVPGVAVLTSGVRDFARSYDARRGGFGQAPKFPRPSELFFLLRESARTGDDDARRMVEGTLQAMALGGMRDHVGGGFHRYAVDADWRVPHFEKMLYDQAQLVLAYLEAFQLTGEPAYADVAEDTLTYVARDLTDVRGGFHSAEDADSPPAPGALSGGTAPPGRPRPTATGRSSEGAFYLWTWEAFGDVLGGDAELARRRFGVRAGGNAPFDPHEEFGAGNILFAARDLESLAAESGEDLADVAARLEEARQRLFLARAVRPRPHRDDKVITAWNGLAIGAFARAARVLGLEDHLASAERAAVFVQDVLWDASSQTLLRRYRDGDAAIGGFADDYANLVFGLLELFQAGGDARWLEWAIILQRRMDSLFWNDAGGGWFGTTGADPSILLRSTEDYDGAEPSASSVAASNLLTLAHLTGQTEWVTKAEATFGAFAARLTSSGRAMPQMLAALSAYHAGPGQLVIVGRRDDEQTRALAEIGARQFLPFTVTLMVEPGEQQARLAGSIPEIGAMTLVGGRPAAYLCRGFVCQAPVTEPAELARLLGTFRPRFQS